MIDERAYKLAGWQVNGFGIYDLTKYVTIFFICLGVYFSDRYYYAPVVESN